MCVYVCSEWGWVMCVRFCHDVVGEYNQVAFEELF
jgi:hypothetical protein